MSVTMRQGKPEDWDDRTQVFLTNFSRSKTMRVQVARSRPALCEALLAKQKKDADSQKRKKS